jgi:hypothetical protein
MEGIVSLTVEGIVSLTVEEIVSLTVEGIVSLTVEEIVSLTRGSITSSRAGVRLVSHYYSGKTQVYYLLRTKRMLMGVATRQMRLRPSCWLPCWVWAATAMRASRWDATARRVKAREAATTGAGSTHPEDPGNSCR